MPHLSFEYSAGLGTHVDLPGFVARMRAAMVATGVLPEPGLRIRGFEADHCAVGDGGPLQPHHGGTIAGQGPFSEGLDQQGWQHHAGANDGGQITLT